MPSQNVIRLRPLESGVPRTPASDLSATSPKHFPGKVVVNELAQLAQLGAGFSYFRGFCIA
jgi:hypothetical protein